ncbi:MAG: VOC family protein, partial [Flavobacteriales bacterium]
QAEIDSYWDRLTDGGMEMPCGWLRDRFGLTWQIVPKGLDKMLMDPNPAKAGATKQALLKMK